ncbi:hypothetical protein [Nonomuraea turcica]|uniref:hypothetical protein n=1 Tax=Nonomuraea sp. G32 TaxID=3067274 RepID=UPI00273C9C33|nr:hypothetical protein [Nonomuraea sp. G32]MDP4509509.1 hypothetical protein [Nonomuraea sp. G32]
MTGWLAGTLGYPAAFALITGVIVLLPLLAPALRRPSPDARAPLAPKDHEEPVDRCLPA